MFWVFTAIVPSNISFQSRQINAFVLGRVNCLQGGFRFVDRFLP